MLFIITLLSAINNIINIEKRNFEKRLTKLNKIRKVALNKRIKISKELAKKLYLQRQSFIKNNLVKLRKLDQDNQKLHKLKFK